MPCGDTLDWPQPIPVPTALPWAPPSWTHPRAHFPAQPWPVPVPREVPDAQAWGCLSAPQAALLLAGAVGWALAARPCRDMAHSPHSAFTRSSKESGMKLQITFNLFSA